MNKILKLTIFLGVMVCVFVIFTPKAEATQYPDLSWATTAAEFKIYAGATANDDADLTWNNGTLICSVTLTDTNADIVSCDSGTINPSQTYRVQAVLENDSANADADLEPGNGDFVDHVNVKAGTPENWAGLSPTLVDCGFEDIGGDDTPTTVCTVGWSGNDVRMTNTGSGSTVMIIRGGASGEGFMYLITTDSTVYTSSASYMNSTIDLNSQDSSKITITKYTVPPPSVTLKQVAYKWFQNNDSTAVGGAGGINTAVTAPTQGMPFRLRLLFYVDGADLGSSGTTTKLQYAVRSGTCDTAFEGESYNDVTGSTDIRYYDNTDAGATDGAALTVSTFDPRHSTTTGGGGNMCTVVNQDYEEANNFTNSEGAILRYQDGLWDFSLVDYSAPAGTTYCFRAVQSGGGELDTYDVIPEITTAQRNKVRLRGTVRLRVVRLF